MVKSYLYVTMITERRSKPSQRLSTYSGYGGHWWQVKAHHRLLACRVAEALFGTSSTHAGDLAKGPGGATRRVDRRRHCVPRAYGMNPRAGRLLADRLRVFTSPACRKHSSLGTQAHRTIYR